MDLDAFDYTYSWNLEDWLNNSAQPESWFTLLDYQGDGFLTFASIFWRQLSGTQGNDLPTRITVDGVSFICDFEKDVNVTTWNMLTSYHMTDLIRFEESIKIETYNSHPDNTYRPALAYSIMDVNRDTDDDVNALKDKVYMHDMKLTSGTNGNNVEVINVSGAGYLMQIEGKASGSSSRYALKVEVDGVTIIDQELLSGTDVDYKSSGFFKGPIKFNNNLTVYHRSGASNARLFTDVYYLLD